MCPGSLMSKTTKQSNPPLLSYPIKSPVVVFSISFMFCDPGASPGQGFLFGLEGGKVLVYEFKNVNGHIEVFLDGVFQFSGDTMSEAYRDLEEFNEQKRVVF